MNETPLTQEAIDNGANGETATRGGLLRAAANHPIIAGGAILIGAGLGYVVVKAIAQGNAKDVARKVHVETSIAIDRSPSELYTFWRDFKNLPLFMKNLDSVTEVEPGKTHWVVKAANGMKAEWDAEIYNEIPYELIAWRSLEDADITNAGSVRFQPAPHGRGTYIRVTLNYNPPAGTVGATLLQLLGSEPRQLIKEDLRRLKQIIETGEIATVTGQTSGRAAADAVPAEPGASRFATAAT